MTVRAPRYIGCSSRIVFGDIQPWLCWLVLFLLQRQANTVAGSSALALVVINSGADGEDLFRLAATLGGSNGGGEEPKGPKNMPTVSPVETCMSLLTRCYVANKFCENEFSA